MRMIKRFLMWLLIPRGLYCHDEKETCPFYSKICGIEDSANCRYIKYELNIIDVILLEDQCKICGQKLWDGKN